MQLFKEILGNLLLREQINVTFPNLRLSCAEMVELECFHALSQIKVVLEDETLPDFDCVEKIVGILENYGASAGARHDF